MLNFKN